MTGAISLKLEELPQDHAIDEAREAIQETLAEAGSRVATLKWDLFRGTICRALSRRLGELDMFEQLAGAWCSMVKLRELAKKTLAAPGTEEAFPLGKHRPKQELHPVVTINVGPFALPPLRFTLSLEGQVESGILIVANGRLAAIELASLTPSASLAYKKSVLKTLEAPKFATEGRYNFAGGILIPTG